MAQLAPVGYLDALRKGQLRDSLPAGLSASDMRHAARGRGQALIVTGLFALVIGAWLVVGTVSWPDVLLNETPHVQVGGPDTSAGMSEVPVDRAGRYILISRKAGLDQSHLPMLSEVAVLKGTQYDVDATSSGGGPVVRFRDRGDRARRSSDQIVVYAVPAENPPTRIDMPRLIRNIVITALGVVLIVVGTTLGYRRRRALRAYARAIDASQRPDLNSPAGFGA